MAGGSTVIKDRYRIDRELATGGRAASWLVTDLRNARPCVLKRLREADAPPGGARLFEAQAGVLARLDHPGIPRLIEYFVEGEGAAREHVLVTAYFPGESVERLVAKDRPLTEAQAVALLLRLSAVLAYLHGFDPPLVHRSLKPANVVVGPDGRVCLTDFHFASLDAGGKAGEEGPPEGGEPTFAAPEAAAGAPVPASDIYAAGMTVVYGMTGIDPGDLAHDAGRLRLREAVRASEGFLAVLARMVEPSLDKRYPDVRALEADLARLAAGRGPVRPAAASAAASASPAPSAAASPREKAAPAAGSPALKLTLAAALVAALAAGVLFWYRGARHPEPVGQSLVPAQQATAPAAEAGPPPPPAAPEAAPPAPVPPAPEAGAASPAVTGPAGLPAQGALPAGTVPGAGPPPAPAAAPAPVEAPAPAEPPATSPAPPPPPPVTAGDVSATGRLLFDGEPVTRLTSLRPVFWFRNVDRKSAEKPQVDYADGAFSVRGLPAGRMGVSARIDLSSANPNLFPGDLDGYAAFTVAPGAAASVDVHLRRVMRLLQPLDNGAPIPGWEAACGAGVVLPRRVLLSWEPLEAGTHYDVTIDRLDCARGNAPAGRAVAAGGSDAWVNLELPPSREGECYSLRLSARRAGRPVGIMTTHGKSAVAWDLKFTVK